MLFDKPCSFEVHIMDTISKIRKHYKDEIETLKRENALLKEELAKKPKQLVKYVKVKGNQNDRTRRKEQTQRT